MESTHPTTTFQPHKNDKQDEETFIENIPDGLGHKFNNAHRHHHQKLDIQDRHQVNHLLQYRSISSQHYPSQIYNQFHHGISAQNQHNHSSIEPPNFDRTVLRSGSEFGQHWRQRPTIN